MLEIYISLGFIAMFDGFEPSALWLDFYDEWIELYICIRYLDRYRVISIFQGWTYHCAPLKETTLKHNASTDSGRTTNSVPQSHPKSHNHDESASYIVGEVVNWCHEEKLFSQLPRRMKQLIQHARALQYRLTWFYGPRYFYLTHKLRGPIGRSIALDWILMWELIACLVRV